MLKFPFLVVILQIEVNTSLRAFITDQLHILDIDKLSGFINKLFSRLMYDALLTSGPVIYLKLSGSYVMRTSLFEVN